MISNITRVRFQSLLGWITCILLTRQIEGYDTIAIAINIIAIAISIELILNLRKATIEKVTKAVSQEITIAARAPLNFSSEAIAFRAGYERALNEVLKMLQNKTPDLPGIAGNLPLPSKEND